MKNAIITGASRGTGEAMALRLGQMGYNVVVNYRSNSSKELAEALIARLKEEHGVETIAVQADVSRYEDCEKLVQSAVDAFGEKIDVLINNAGMNSRSPFCELTREKYMAVLETNLISAFHMCHFVVPYMVKANGGCVINTSSGARPDGVCTTGGLLRFQSGADRHDPRTRHGIWQAEYPFQLHLPRHDLDGYAAWCQPGRSGRFGPVDPDGQDRQRRRHCQRHGIPD